MSNHLPFLPLHHSAGAIIPALSGFISHQICTWIAGETVFKTLYGEISVFLLTAAGLGLIAFGLIASDLNSLIPTISGRTILIAFTILGVTIGVTSVIYL